MNGPRVRWWALGALVVLAAPIGWLVFIADGWTVNRLVVAIWTPAVELGFDGSPEAFGELLNILLLLPATLLASLWVPRVPWWVWTVLAGAVSLIIESVQYFTPRDANASDLMTNTLGALVGALIGAWINAAAARRRSGLVEGAGGVLGQEPGGDHRDGEHRPEQREEDR